MAAEAPRKIIKMFTGEPPPTQKLDMFVDDGDVSVDRHKREGNLRNMLWV